MSLIINSKSESISLTISPSPSSSATEAEIFITDDTWADAMARQKQLELQQEQTMIGGVSGGLIGLVALVVLGLALQYSKKKRLEEQKKKDAENLDNHLSVNPIVMNNIIKKPNMMSPIQGKLIAQQQRVSFGEKLETLQPSQLRKSLESQMEEQKIKANTSKNSFIPLATSLNNSPIKINRVNNNTNNTISNPLEISKSVNKINKSPQTQIQQKVEGGERQFFPAQMIRPSDRNINKVISTTTTKGSTGTTNYLNNLNMYQSSNKRPISIRNPIKSNVLNNKNNIYNSIEK